MTARRGAGLVRPSVLIGAGDGTPVSGTAKARLVRTVVDTHLHLPGMFALTFRDTTGAALADAGLSIGTPVQVWAGALTDRSARRLITGEVTAIEGRYENLGGYTVVRGYDLGHRLQRVRRTRTFVNMTDADIASQIGREADLPLGEISASSVVHTHLGQCDETDWDFLKHRAREVGYEFGMDTEGKFRFRKASAANGADDEPVTLTLGTDLRYFAPRLTSGNLTPEVEVRVWDPLRAQVTSSVIPLRSGTTRTDGPDAGQLGRQFARAAERPSPEATPSTGESLGPPPNGTAHVITDRPAGSGASAHSAAEQVADGLAGHLGSTFAEAEGATSGNPRIQAGAVVRAEGVPRPFVGVWLVTSARHVFDSSRGGYRTEFTVSGRHERSLLGLASVGATQSPLPRIPGVVCGIVTNVNDAKSRVKVALPWLSPAYETDWAPVVQFGAGRRSGAMFLPEVGDEVLIGFEFGDTRRPYVLGGIVNDHSGYDLGGPAVEAAGETGEVVRRGFVSASGNRLAFHDQMPPGTSGGRPLASEIVLGTGDGTLRLAIDAVAGTLVLACTPDDPPGRLTIECGNAGTVDIKTGPGGTVNVDGGATLSLKAQMAVQIESDGEVSVKGAQIRLN
jgi:phage protein D